MQINTHENIDRRLCGTPEALGAGKAIVSLETTSDMAVDEKGLVHGGFIFGLADHAAMLAVNEPFVVLAASQCKFLKPCKAGERLTASASVTEEAGKRRTVEVTVANDCITLFTGSFSCAVLDSHVLD